MDKFGAVDTGEWDDPELAGKAVVTPDLLSAAERTRWLKMLLKVGLTDPYVLSRGR